MKRYLLIALPLLALLIVSCPDLFAQTKKAEARQAYDQGTELTRKSQYKEAAAKFLEAITIDPEFADAHSDYTFARKMAVTDLSNRSGSKDAVEKETVALCQEYEGLAARNPRLAVFEWVLSDLFIYRDYGQMEAHLKKALAIDPKYSKALQSYALLEEVKGNQKGQLEYLRKAAAAQPDNPDMAFYYANSLKSVKPAAYERESLAVARRFPSSERGAQSLYWLAFNETQSNRKIEILEQLRQSFPIEKFSWSRAGMSQLYEQYHVLGSDKALELAEAMLKLANSDYEKRTWTKARDFERRLKQAEELLAANSADDALKVLQSAVKPDRLDATRLFKMKIRAAADEVSRRTVYAELVAAVVTEPSDRLINEMTQLGSKLGKDTLAISRDVDARLDSLARPAADLVGSVYGAGSTFKLSSQHGRVTMLNFWYPFCGPCRGENPGLQRVYSKLKSSGFQIIAVNVHGNEDSFVLPYIKGNGFGFLPVKGSEAEAEKDWEARGFPTNFLIDTDGKVIYKLGPMRGENEERRLELQIKFLLDRAARRKL